MKKKIWLGRGISNNISLIQHLRSLEFTVFVSHILPEWSGKQYAISFQEPDLHGNDYIDWTYKTLKEENFDFFMPGRCLGDFQHFPAGLSNRLVLGCSPERINELDDKALFYKKCQSAGFDFVADFHVFNDRDSFLNSFNKLSTNHNRICFKPSKGIFGQGFRVITDSNPLEIIEKGSSLHIRKKDILQAFDDYPEYIMKDMVMMPMFNGREISVDGSFDGLNYRLVARLKNNSGGQLIILDEQVYENSLKVANLFGLKGIFNIQFMLHDGIPMLLEVNPRPAGGIGMSLFSDVQIINNGVFGNNISGEDVLLKPKREDNIATEKIYYIK